MTRQADGRLPRPPRGPAPPPSPRGSIDSRPSIAHPPAAAAALTNLRLRFRVASGGGEVPPRPPRSRGRRPSLGGRREAAPAMGDIHEVPRPRIATGQLAQHIGQPVCFVGRVEKIHPSGKLIVLTDGLGKHTTVELSEPLDEEISGVIEVVGRVTNQATIMCASFVQFREDKSAFDLELYNEALKIIHEFREYFPFGTGINT